MAPSSFTMQQKAACVVKFIETRSITAVQRWYRTTYRSSAPSGNAIRLWRRNLSGFGTVAQRPRSGRPSVSAADVARIENSFHENPRLSLRRASTELEIPASTIRDVLRKKLKMFPYRISFLQELRPND